MIPIDYRPRTTLVHCLFALIPREDQSACYLVPRCGQGRAFTHAHTLKTTGALVDEGRIAGAVTVPTGPGTLLLWITRTVLLPK